MSFTITRGKTLIEVPHQSGTIVVAHPFYGPANAKELQRQIRAESAVQLREATLGEVVSFLHPAYTDTDAQKVDEFVNAKDIMRNQYVRSFTTVSFDPNTKLAYITDAADFDENSVAKTNLDNLIQRAHANDSSVRTIALSDITGGAKKSKQLEKNKYLIALVGQEGAVKLAKIASQHPAKEGYVNLPDFSQRADRIVSLRSGDGGGLVVSSSIGNYDNGCAFGIVQTTK